MEGVVKWLQRTNNYPEEMVLLALDLLKIGGISSVKEFAEMDSKQRDCMNIPSSIENDILNLIKTLGTTSEEAINEHMKASPSAIPPPPIKTPQVDQSNLNTSRKKKRKTGKDGFCYVFHDKEGNEMIISVSSNSWRFPDDISLKKFFQSVPGGGKLFTDDSTQIFINENISLKLALQEGRVLLWGTTYHRIIFQIQFKGIENWLRSLYLPNLIYTFYEHYIDDFLVLPFLDEQDLMYMNISREKQEIILKSIGEIKNGGNGNYFRKWLQYLGFGEYAENFVEHYLEICFLNRLKEAHLARIGIDKKDRAQIFEIVRQYSEFSSVEAAYVWLQDHAFDKVSFRFVRFNIPFYALPLVNFFIVHEMGIVNHKELLTSLEQLKDTPAYRVKALAYWLRDLELERYALAFAKKSTNNFIETLSALTEDDIDKLIEWNDDKQKMSCAVKDMKEFHLYFATTASLVDDLMMDKYGHLFLSNDIPIDMIPDLNDAKLKEIGISEQTDRETILQGIEKMKRDFPEICSKISSCSKYQNKEFK